MTRLHQGKVIRLMRVLALYRNSFLGKAPKLSFSGASVRFFSSLLPGSGLNLDVEEKKKQVEIRFSRT